MSDVQKETDEEVMNKVSAVESAAYSQDVGCLMARASYLERRLAIVAAENYRLRAAVDALTPDDAEPVSKPE